MDPAVAEIKGYFGICVHLPIKLPRAEEKQRNTLNPSDRLGEQFDLMVIIAVGIQEPK